MIKIKIKRRGGRGDIDLCDVEESPRLIRRVSPVIEMVLVLLVSAGNFALGFALAVYFGHGPTELPFLKNLLNKPAASRLSAYTRPRSRGN